MYGTFIDSVIDVRSEMDRQEEVENLLNDLL